MVDVTGDRGAPIGHNRFVSVKKFKGKILVNVREYYKDKESGDLKPGKKGITLTPVVWGNLKALNKKVDEAIKDLEDS